MDATRVLDILNDLLTAESASQLWRLAECGAFFDRHDAAGSDTVRGLARRHEQELHGLAGLIMDLGGQPRPAVRDIHTANFHYINCDVLLPHVLKSEEQLAQRCDAALEELSEAPAAADFVRDLRDKHRVRADLLRKMQSQAAH